jgi:hypothetical protein
LCPITDSSCHHARPDHSGAWTIKRRLLAGGAVAIAGAIDMANAVIIRVQGSSLLDPRVLFVSMFIAATAVLAGSQPSADGQICLVCGAAATGGLLGAGVVGIVGSTFGQLFAEQAAFVRLFRRGKSTRDQALCSSGRADSNRRPLDPQGWEARFKPAGHGLDPAKLQVGPF